MNGAYIFGTPPPPMIGGHAFLAPSSAPRWRRCALSASLEAAFPQTEESPEQMEGTCGHWVLESIIKGHTPAEGSFGPKCVVVTAKMLEAAHEACNVFQSMLGPRWREMLVIERRVQIGLVHPTHCSGTPDYYAWAMLPDGRRYLFIFDYKFGMDLVEVFENDQLVSYYGGIMGEVPDWTSIDMHTTVVFCIIQPNAFHRDGPVRTWKVQGSDLRAHLNILRHQADLATSPNPPATPGPEQCKNCLGRVHCEANQRGAYSAAAQSERMGMVQMTPQAMGLELRALKHAAGVLAARITGLEAETVAAIERGGRVPFWSMDRKPGRLEWDVPHAHAIAAGALLGKNIARPPEAMTPTQAIAAGMDENLVKTFASRKSSVKLVPDDGTKARLTFMSSNT